MRGDIVNNQAYINLKNILGKKYPKTAGIYVVSQSILDDKLVGSKFGYEMMKYIGNVPSARDTKGTMGSVSILSAMDFLKKVIANEKRKEAQFISFLSKETNLSPPSSSEDWATFVKTFQSELDIGLMGIKRLENEKARLDSNIQIQGKNIITKSEKELTIYVRERLDVLEYTKKALNGVVNYLSGGSSRMGKKIVDYIYKKYGDRLVTVFATNEGIDIKLNQNNTSGLILSISQLFIESFYTQEIKQLTENKTLKSANYLIREFEKFSENFLTQDTRAKEQIDALITRTEELPFITRDLAGIYQLRNKEGSDNIEPPKFDLSTGQATEKEINQLKQYLRKTTDTAPTVKLTKNTYGLSEVSSIIRQMAAGAIGGQHTGNLNAKPDNLIAWVSIDYANEEVTKEMMQDVHLVEETINYEIKSLKESLSNANTIEYYKKQQKHWQEVSNYIENLLKVLKEKYSILANCFIIEDSTKHYINMGINKEKDFSGGSLGANIQEQIGKILALQNGGLITKADADWLIAAAINCGPGLIGSHLKDSLEDYLAAFAVILLFDDQQGIANEVANKTIETIPQSETTVNKIHLFSLDGGYYPLSLVLQLTYDKLAEIYGLLDSEINNEHGAQVEISGFINPDNEYPPHTANNMTRESWDKLSKQAQESVKMQVKFITNFMGLLNTILAK